MSEAFVSYRRSDSADATGRICDRLSRHFGGGFVFTDVNSISGGADFPSAIRAAIKVCDFVLLIIGPRWLGMADQEGRRRLDDPKDVVRMELEAALAHDKQIIPVLIAGAVMPEAEALPLSIQPIAFRNAIPVRPDPDFEVDIQRLIRALENGRARRPMHPDGWRALAPRLRWGAGIVLLTAASLAIAELAGAGVLPEGWDPWPGLPEDPPGGSAAELLAASVPYDENFVSAIRVPHPAITDEGAVGDALQGKVLHYIHYSLVVNQRRGMPLYTAANVDRTRLISVRREMDRWFPDPRIPAELQHGSGVYSDNDWDRGHLVPRLAVAWGDTATARRAALATFFYPNATPQAAAFNRGNWALLENYVLRELEPASTRISIFSGPVGRSDDYEYRNARIPRSFWKIVAVSDPGKRRNMFVYAYLMDQYAHDRAAGEVVALKRDPAPFDPRKYQVPVTRIEELTPLKFGVLKDFDTFAKGSSGRDTLTERSRARGPE